ncbi:MAG TPA: hypothetical protein VG819_11455 [Rhizomicrobium sp.]|jgi:hypothetical protein|nr:hypothetical protein [Rhizomicrobium sp.]
MRLTKSSPFLFALALATVSTSAMAGEQENALTCINAGKQVSAALAGAHENADAARQERKTALEFCNAGFYHQGMIHYARAMELLGVKG